MESFPFTRLVVVGVTGSGKSTLAQNLAEKLNLEYIELDALHWLPNWSHLSDEEFRVRVQKATCAPRWVIAGNYSIARDISWPCAEAVLWLDYSLWTVFWQLTFRTFRRWWTKELLWGTNYESLWTHFKLWSDDSLWHWLFKTYWRRKRDYPRLFASPEYSHLKVFRFKTPEETQKWLTGLQLTKL